MKLRTTWIVLALMTGSLALAQQPGERPRPGGPGGRMDGPGRFGGGAARIEGWLQRLTEQLNLDAAQQAQLDQIMAAHRAQLAAHRAELEEIQVAWEAGDRARAQELREQMTGRGMNSTMDQVLAEIEKILRPEQLDTFIELRQDFGRRGDNRRQIVQLARELPGVVGFDPQQQQMFNELLDSRRDRMRERMSEMQGFWDELRAAREAGDEARVAELRALMAELRPSAEQQVAELLDEVALFLRPDQKLLLAEYREAFDSNHDPARRTNDVETMLRVVRRLGLSDEQREELKVLEEDVKKLLREVRRGDREAHAVVAAEVRERLDELLTPEQHERFVAQLERQGSRARRGGR